MIRLSLCYAYYRNSAMLAEQFRVWSAYPADLKSRIEVLVIDDGSPEPAIDVMRPSGLPALTIGRLSDVADPFTPPWRQDAARNRAAHEACGAWLFLSDMDHVLPADSLRRVFDVTDEATDDAVYTFLRLDAPALTPKLNAKGERHPHPNTYLMRRDLYWSLGGYDETEGVYGTDGPFRGKVLSFATLTHLDDVPIVRFPREVIPDASTRVDRAAFKHSDYRKRPPLSLAWQAQYRSEAA